MLLIVGRQMEMFCMFLSTRFPTHRCCCHFESFAVCVVEEELLVGWSMRKWSFNTGRQATGHNTDSRFISSSHKQSLFTVCWGPSGYQLWTDCLLQKLTKAIVCALGSWCGWRVGQSLWISLPNTQEIKNREFKWMYRHSNKGLFPLFADLLRINCNNLSQKASLEIL